MRITQPTTMACLVGCCYAGCGDGDGAAATPDVADTADLSEVASPVVPLGLNDLTFLLPLPEPGAPSLIAVDALVTKALFERLVTTPGDILTDYERFRVVALRFDLCDRTAPVPCAPTADGSLRIVLQPFASGATPPSFEDVALHAFYPIPHGDLPQVVAQLRALAAQADHAPNAALAVNPALTAEPDGAYALGLRALVMAYAAPDRLLRLTCVGQFTQHASLHWLFRGLERRAGGELESITIPGVDVAQQEVLLMGELSYEVTPASDDPAGFATALDDSAFDAADAAGRTRALESLVAIDHPLAHTPETVQCASCHVATPLMRDRATRANIDPLTVAGRFTARPALDLSPLVPDDTFSGRTLRALGYLGRSPVASQRVVNETAQVLMEIEARF